ncbi:MAG: ATP-binding protein [Patescibacteria group bacterium]|jgi:hypothetical protein
MLQTILEQNKVEDLKQLIENEIHENRTIEYKQTLLLDSSENKKEFLKDVSSFANTEGGDLIFGLKEENGLPTAIVGLELHDIDAEKLRIESLIRDGIEPRIQSKIHTIFLDDHKVVIIIRIKKSWTAPHRVILGGHDKFYARNSAGKYPMNTNQLREMFNASMTIYDKIKQFRVEKLAEIIADETPVSLSGKTKIVLHIIPFTAFDPITKFTIEELQSISGELRPIYSYGYTPRININGLLNYSSSEQSIHTYLQLYRNGIIEAVDSSILDRTGKEKYIPDKVFEKEILEALTQYLSVIKQLSLHSPYVIALTLINIRGYKFRRISGLEYHIEKDTLILPESIIDPDVIPNASSILRPMFDIIWNACGLIKSPNFDKDNKWIGDKH